MLKRPKPGENEEDILRMQEEFLREKDNGQNIQPAAQLIDLRHINTTPANQNLNAYQPCPKISKYAQSRGLKSLNKTQTVNVVDAVLEKNISQQKSQEIEDDKVYYPKLIPSVLGNIVEKNIDDADDFTFKPMPSGFPVVTSYKINSEIKNFVVSNASDKYQQSQHTNDQSDIKNGNKELVENILNIPSKSYILSSNEVEIIHNENINILKNMSEKEILEEQKKLLSNLDPKLINFVKSKRLISVTDKLNKDTSNNVDKMDINELKSNLDEDDPLWENDIFSHSDVKKWLHFDAIEKDKLEWTKLISQYKMPNPTKPYEARFDFKGYLLPYSIEYTETTKTLFHHGEESHRPGYTVSELFELARSAVIQQRVMALQTIGGLLEYYVTGAYKDVIEIPLTKIFFLLRIAIDENKSIILEPSLKAMRNLFYNKVDEASLDALVGTEEGLQQPCLENDKSEIFDLESKESEINDFHLAEIDLVTALLRTNILQRIYYILETVRPSLTTVQYALQLLIRLVRDSVETAKTIADTQHLMTTITKNFVPVTSINFTSNSLAIYDGKPLLVALKFIRVLSVQSKEISQELISKYGILESISTYINSGVGSTYGLRVQIESFNILFNLMQHNSGINCAVSLCPVITTNLYKHLHGTDIFVDSSVLSVTHCAVVLQTVNKILVSHVSGLDIFKQQIYPLLKEGIKKWLTQTASSENYTCAHLRLLCAALDCCKTIVINGDVMIKSFQEILNILLSSKGFNKIKEQILSSSNLLSGIPNQNIHFIKNLVTLGTTVTDSTQTILPILNATSPLPFLSSLFKLLAAVADKQLANNYVPYFYQYLIKLKNNVPTLCSNWFTRIEINFLFNLIKLSTYCNMTDEMKNTVYAVAGQLCYILRIDRKYEIDFLFNNILFNKQWFTAERVINLISMADTEGFIRTLSCTEDIKVCYSKVINLNYQNQSPNIVLKKWQEPILPRDWIYLPILTLYTENQELPTIIDSKRASSSHENSLKLDKEFIVSCSLEWILFNELCFSDLLNEIDITDRFCRIMCIFLCDNSLFLDKKIKVLLGNCIQTLFKREKITSFNFDKQITGLNNFQDFYTQLLEQFQSVSYGDSTFAACVLVPLAQKHNVKWRKLIWSEYAGCLRALDCPEEMLCYNIDEYFYPIETDGSVLKSYVQALSSQLLRPNTVAYRIAEHHVRSFKQQSSTTPVVDEVMVE